MTTIKYHNGNTTVTIEPDGTKVREYFEEPLINFPESIDVKITDYCNLGCQYCHESSTLKGKHGDLLRLLDVLEELPAGVELAIGGGNPLAHPGLLEFLKNIKSRGLIANLTINQGHLQEYEEFIVSLINSDLVKGVGISITSNNFKYIQRFKKLSKNIVYHVIAGVNKIEVLDALVEIGDAKILVLGYKQFGFGEKYFNDSISNEIKRWSMYIPKYLNKSVLSFDNLAIEQLDIKRLFTEDGWNKFYMGDDFTFTMYIDAVKNQYAPTSRSQDRKSFLNFNLIQYFNTFKNKAT